MRRFLLFISALGGFLFARAPAADQLVVHDPDGTLAAAHAPVSIRVRLTPEQRRAALEGRLFLQEIGPTSGLGIPTQILAADGEPEPTFLCWLLPDGAKGRRTFRPEIRPDATASGLTAQRNPEHGQFELQENGRLVLRYNYALVEPGRLLDSIQPANRIYARARSDYIHPLAGPQGEILTCDWPLDHPHHRGIYWAWPEVDWRGQRGDLHALQRVFARPVGRCFAAAGPVFAQLIAENLWKWDDAEALVRERAVIRAYRAVEGARVLDLELEFLALGEPVHLARRGTDKYGGLNLRFARVSDQQILTHTDPPGSALPRAWAQIAGRFGGSDALAGVLILQHPTNPDYPGQWVEFPNLNWVQPTFPAAGTRWELRPDRPLVLRYRLWIHPGGPAEAEACARQWEAFRSPFSPKFFPEPARSKRPKAS